MHKIERVLVPVDFSGASKQALGYAAFLAERFGAKVDVLHVWRQVEYTGDAMVVLTRSEPELTLATFMRDQADQQLNEFLSGLPHEKRMLEAGEPAPTIVNVATEGGYDLVVMGTHGRTGLTHVLMGSVAEKVVRLSPCPVVTYRASEKAHKA